MVLECENCAALVSVEILASYVRSNPYDWMDAEKYSFGKCPQCSQPILGEQTYDYVGEDVEWGRHIRLYPGNLFNLNPAIPLSLRKALLESIQCYKSNSFTATVIMCRRTLEGFCYVRGACESNLSQSIKKLKDSGDIDTQLYEWAHQLRLSGNEAAHNYSSEFSDLDAKDILDFTIAILDFTFSYKDKFDKFKARKKNPN